MSEDLTLRPIGRIRTEFPEKFGIPRQSGLVEELRAVVEFEREFRAPEAFRASVTTGTSRWGMPL